MAVKLHSGQLKHRITFKEPVRSLNDESGEEFSYDPPASTIQVSSAVKNVSQRRITEANVTTLTGSLDFYVRHSNMIETVDKDWLLNYKGVDHVIHEIEEIEQDVKWFCFTAKASTNG